MDNTALRQTLGYYRAEKSARYKAGGVHKKLHWTVYLLRWLLVATAVTVVVFTVSWLMLMVAFWWVI